MDNASAFVQAGQAADGTLTYLVAHPPAALPPVNRRDLAAAWEAAHGGARAARWGAARRFLFRQVDGTVLDFALEDRDARCWAGAVDAMAGLRTAYGVSLCLRLLALVDLLAKARWAAPLLRMRRGAAELDPGLLRLAATVELTNDARFDETRFRAGLMRLAPPEAGAPP